MTETYEDLKLRERFVRTLSAVPNVDSMTKLDASAAITRVEMTYPTVGDAPTGFIAFIGGHGATFRVTVERIHEDDNRSVRTASGK